MAPLSPDEHQPPGGSPLNARHRLWRESGPFNRVWLDIGLLKTGVPALEFFVDSRTYRFALNVNDLRLLAAEQSVLLRSAAAECGISPKNPTLNFSFRRKNGRGLSFAMPVEALRAGLRSLTEPPRRAVVDDGGRTEIRVALTDLVWGSVTEGLVQISLEGSEIVVRLNPVG